MKISDPLISWYKNNKRDLPWRNTNNLYHIWVSEVILQQTRVAQGLQYYYNFLERFPDIESLANADESDVLKIWQGLGYYSRARNMHIASKQIFNDYGGIIPSDYNNLIKIKGIGNYTASAILSFGYKLPYPVIDGNVKRVISRIFAIKHSINSSQAEKLISKKVNSLFDKNNPSDFNQAIMEFGALQCKPSLPDCKNCIFNHLCLAYKRGEVLQYPHISKKPVITERYFYYIVAIFYRNGKPCTFFLKRNNNDIWKNLYEFPLIELQEKTPVEEVLKSDNFNRLFPITDYEITSAKDTYAHKLSHQIIHAEFIKIDIHEDLNKIDLPEILVSEIAYFPISRLTDKYLSSKNYMV